jgi:hypothetical protein
VIPEADVRRHLFNVSYVPKAASAAAHCTASFAAMPSTFSPEGDIEVEHRRLQRVVPLRNRNEIEKRGLDHEPRRTLTRAHSSENWQSVFHRHACLAGRLNEVWAANSASRDGCLDVYGKRAVGER